MALPAEHLYERLFLFSLLCADLFVHVYGGAKSIIIGANVWSLSSYFGTSSSTAGVTLVLGVSIKFSGLNVSNCSAISITSAAFTGMW